MLVALVVVSSLSLLVSVVALVALVRLHQRVETLATMVFDLGVEDENEADVGEEVLSVLNRVELNIGKLTQRVVKLQGGAPKAKKKRDDNSQDDEPISQDTLPEGTPIPAEG